MSASKSQRQQTILTEDGELVQADSAAADSQTEALFCTTCGTANKASSRFCRKCGQSLDDQAADLDAYHNIAPEFKGKRSAQRQMQVHQQPGMQMNLWMLIFQIVLLFMVAMLTFITSRDGLAGVSIIVLFIWFLIEAAMFGVLK
jgi:hypothetical protein